MATDYTTDNIVNLNQGVSLTNAAINVIKKIKDKISFVFEYFTSEDVSEFRTYNTWQLYIVTQDNKGIETPRFFYREINTRRDINQKIISETDMAEFIELKPTEYDLDFIENIKAGGSIDDMKYW